MGIGAVIGFLFGFNGIATLFSFMSEAITEAQAQLSSASAISTLILFIIAVLIIVKIRVISSLIIGAIIGAVLNLILELNGIHVVDIIYTELMKNIGIIQIDIPSALYKP